MKNPLIHATYEKSDGSGEVAELLILGDTIIASTYPDEGHLLKINPNDSWELTQTIQAVEQSTSSALGNNIICRHIRLDCADLDLCNDVLDMRYEDEDIFENCTVFQDLVTFILEREAPLAIEIIELEDYEEEVDSDISKILVTELTSVTYDDTYSSDEIVEYETIGLLDELLYRDDLVMCFITDEDFSQILSANGYASSDENILILKTALREMTSRDYYKELAKFAATKHSVRFLLQKK